MKYVLTLFTAISLAIIFTFSPVQAAYLSEYDQYVEVSYEDARYIADLLGMKNIPLGDKTASISFQVQEDIIQKIENRLDMEIDHYYIWLTINGQPVLAIDPPVPMF